MTTGIDLSDLYDSYNAASSKGTSNGSTIPFEGYHTAEIMKIDVKRSEKPGSKHKVFFIAEYKLITSETADAKLNVPYTYIFNLAKEEQGVSWLKNFVAACVGLEPGSTEADALPWEEAQKSWGEEQPLTGMHVKLRSNIVLLKDTGAEYMAHTWDVYETPKSS